MPLISGLVDWWQIDWSVWWRRSAWTRGWWDAGSWQECFRASKTWQWLTVIRGTLYLTSHSLCWHWQCSVVAGCTVVHQLLLLWASLNILTRKKWRRIINTVVYFQCRATQPPSDTFELQNLAVKKLASMALNFHQMLWRLTLRLRLFFIVKKKSMKKTQHCLDLEPLSTKCQNSKDTIHDYVLVHTVEAENE